MSGRRHRLEWRPADPCALNAQRVLPQVAAGFLALGREVLAGEPAPRELHALRLAGKRLRYSLELFREFYGPELGQVLRTLKKLQRMLGEISDCDATETLIRAGGLADAEGARELLRNVAEKRTEATRLFLSRWRSLLGSADLETAWTSALASGPGRPGDSH